ncbi:SPOR domain-containing protein [Sphingomonas sp.]|uniref:SPOR domain-containing protein n=1 Tax=Sphingomonas sp. TaxID=28214 RepID=UPI0025DC4E0E|nr:SPOR domain-containing protein [Sphingomonas sp.]MBV9526834.1 SPOR domain-containing protein [Sphingomonas sp.]
MSDQRSSYEEQLPWLQSVDDEDEPRGVSARKMLAALGVVVLAVVLVGVAFFWIGRRGAEVSGPPELIKADPTPYKVRPPNPGGLDIAGESETAFETSAGQDTDAQLDMSKVPQAEGGPPPAPPKPQPGQPAATVPEAPAQPVATPQPKATGGTGSIVQLGAFQNRAQAERAWTALSTRFGSVAALNKMIVPFPGGIRLRAGAASPADAKQVCDTLKGAGENCFVAQ